MVYSNAMHRARGRKRAGHLLALPIILFVAAIGLATTYVGYVLWPRWPGANAKVEAPSLPITIGNASFNIPPAAIRQNVQRRAGAQERVDLVLLWPSLAPPDPAARVMPPASPQEIDRVFLTIHTADSALPPAERAKTIYPRYLTDGAAAGPEGLAVRSFRDGTPYQGEDMIYDPTAPELFLVRCSRQGAAATPGMCLYDRRIGGADLTLRFPRDWLNDWRNVGQLIERLVNRLQSPAS